MRKTHAVTIIMSLILLSSAFSLFVLLRNKAECEVCKVVYLFPGDTVEINNSNVTLQMGKDLDGYAWKVDWALIEKTLRVVNYPIDNKNIKVILTSMVSDSDTYYLDGLYTIILPFSDYGSALNERLFGELVRVSDNSLNELDIQSFGLIYSYAARGFPYEIVETYQNNISRVYMRETEYDEIQNLYDKAGSPIEILTTEKKYNL